MEKLLLVVMYYFAAVIALYVFSVPANIFVPNSFSMLNPLKWEMSFHIIFVAFHVIIFFTACVIYERLHINCDNGDSI